jgi:hypothetical protein
MTRVLLFSLVADRSEGLIGEGDDYANLSVTLMSPSGDPASDFQARFVADDDACTIEQPQAASDAQGSLQGRISCPILGAVRVFALIEPEGPRLLLQASVLLHFVQGPAVRLEVTEITPAAVSRDFSAAVHVLDKLGRLVADAALPFIVELASSPIASAGLSGTLSGATEKGAARILNLRISVPGAGFKLRARSGMLEATDSAAFGIAPRGFFASEVGLEGAAYAQLLGDPGRAGTIWARTSNTYADGLLRSNDRGQSWQAVDFRLPVTNVSTIAFSNADPGSTYVSTGSGLLRSDDGGASFTRLTTSVTSAFAVAKNDVIVAASFAGLSRSLDQGSSFEPANSGLALGGENYACGFAYVPESDTLFVVMWPGDDHVGTLYRWHDTGAPDSYSWSCIAGDGCYSGGKRSPTLTGGTWVATTLPYGLLYGDTGDPSLRLFVASDRALRSINGGTSFDAPIAGLHSQANFDFWRMPGSPDTVFALGPNGIFRSLDSGGTWSRFADDAPGQPFPPHFLATSNGYYSGDVSPTLQLLSFMAAGTSTWVDTGFTDSLVSIAYAPGQNKVWSVGNTGKIYSASAVGTPTWVQATAIPNFGANIVFADVPGAPGRTLVAGYMTGGGLYQLYASDDGGTVWSFIDTGGRQPIHISHDADGVLRTTSWAGGFGYLQDILPDQFLTFYHPVQYQADLQHSVGISGAVSLAYIRVGTEVYRGRPDGSEGWLRLDLGTPYAPASVSVHPTRPQDVLVSTNMGVLRSLSGGD